MVLIFREHFGTVAGRGRTRHMIFSRMPAAQTMLRPDRRLKSIRLFVDGCISFASESSEVSFLSNHVVLGLPCLVSLIHSCLTVTCCS
eukprot:747574-Hanusia_phi.AAC.14